MSCVLRNFPIYCPRLFSILTRHFFRTVRTYTLELNIRLIINIRLKLEQFYFRETLFQKHWSSNEPPADVFPEHSMVIQKGIAPTGF